MGENTTFEFRQEDVLRRERRFELFDGRYIRVYQARKRQDIDYTIDLLALAPGSERHLRVNWKWLGGAGIAFAICALTTFILFRDPTAHRMLYLVPVLLISLAAALGMAYQFFATSQRCQIFASRYAGVPLLELLINRPDRQRFKAFIQDLEIRIDVVGQRAQLPEDALKAGEMRMLRRLASKGIITGPTYDHAKALILAHS